MCFEICGLYVESICQRVEPNPLQLAFGQRRTFQTKDRGNWTQRTAPAPAAVFILGTGLSFSLGTASQSGDGFFGSGWKAGLKQANKCVDDECAGKGVDPLFHGLSYPVEGPPPPASAGTKVAFPPPALGVPQVAPEGLFCTGHTCRATSAESLRLRSASPRCADLEASGSAH